MTTRQSLNSPDLYTVGWIAALPIERAAATAMLDERHDKPQNFSQHRSDTNSYTWGRMGEHNVVIASLTAGVYGTTSAATTASSLLASLPQIRIGLLVGIGGGIARPDNGRDIRLGDVVVSNPHGATGGVVQYDLGKAKSNNKRERKDFLNMPPPVLLHALANLQSEHYIAGPKVPEFLEEMWGANPRMVKSTKSVPGFVHQGFENDRLFKSSYDHAGPQGCGSCDRNEEVQRDRRDSTDPEIHYGIIASGNTLIKDAATRDKIVEDVGEECLCVEMEAAGLMNHFPCLVIRGICDYADSHKNDLWQCYASATAAAYGKEFLTYVPVRHLQETQRAVDILRAVEGKLHKVHSLTSDIKAGVESMKSDIHLDKVRKWLSPPDTSTNVNAAKEKRHKGTGTWFLASAAFLEWKSGSRRHLWLHGLAGCGKTVLTSTILDHLRDTQTESCVTLDFFFDFRDKGKQQFDNLLRSLAFQLYSQCANSLKDLDSLFASYDDGRKQPTTDPLSRSVHIMMQRPKKLQIILDALDECVTRSELLKWMKTLPELASVHLIATSRWEEELESGLSGWIDKENTVPIDRDLVNADIRSYIKARLEVGEEFQKRWASRPAVLEELEAELGGMAGGMFRWAACQLDILEHCLDYEELQRTLHSLPQTLDETYSRILANIPEGRRERAIRLLQFLVYSERPLTIQEAVDAIAIRLIPCGQFDPKYRLPCPKEITRFCSSLVSLITRESDTGTLMELELAHFSVKEYLTSEKLPEPFQCSFSQAYARGNITRSSLAYLSCLKEEDLIANIAAQFPLAQYSARYWMDHARSSETLDDVGESIMRFFENDIAYTIWCRLFNPDLPWTDRPDTYTACPLYSASRKGLDVTVQKLLDRGADANARGGYFGSALQAASSGGHVKVVQKLLDRGADVNAQGGDYGNALQAASSEGHEKVAQLLLDRGADINAQVGGLYGDALRAASSEGHERIVQLLLDRGADVNTQGGYGDALHAASLGGRERIVQLLLDRGADINAQAGGLHGNALQAASSEGHERIVQLLLDRGADVNAQGGGLDGDALQAASSRGHEKVVQLLLDRGADVNAQAGGLYGALQAASLQGHEKVVQLLLDRGADINAQVGGFYGNALQAASLRGHEKVVQLLRDRGAGVNINYTSLSYIF